MGGMFTKPDESPHTITVWNGELGPTIGFNVVQKYLRENNDSWLLISTLPDTPDGQKCLIEKTTACSREETLMNRIIEGKRQQDICVIIYGRHHMDENVQKKWKQIRGMGFTRAHKYAGGMFEWLLLQDVYGEDNFPTTTKAADILEFEPK